MPSRKRSFDMDEWVTPMGVVLAVSGDLDAMACRVVDQHVRRLLARWPGLLLTLELNQVGKVDLNAAEALVLDIVALRAGEARLKFAVKGGDCHTLLTRLGLAVEPGVQSHVRWPWGAGILPGGTA